MRRHLTPRQHQLMLRENDIVSRREGGRRVYTLGAEDVTEDVLALREQKLVLCWKSGRVNTTNKGTRLLYALKATAIELALYDALITPRAAHAAYEELEKRIAALRLSGATDDEVIEDLNQREMMWRGNDYSDVWRSASALWRLQRQMT